AVDTAERSDQVLPGPLGCRRITGLRVIQSKCVDSLRFALHAIRPKRPFLLAPIEAVAAKAGDLIFVGVVWKPLAERLEVYVPRALPIVGSIGSHERLSGGIEFLRRRFFPAESIDNQPDTTGQHEQEREGMIEKLRNGATLILLAQLMAHQVSHDGRG